MYEGINSRWLVPRTMLTPGMRATSSPFNCVKQPMTTMIASGLRRAACRMILRLFDSPLFVTEHVLMTTTSAVS
ncbi:MAG: hypothetical protein MZU97_26005 [Bacillus subtilis]|nr:hypothetical protein [Bacillus subtilis]